MDVAADHPERWCPRLAAYARVFEAWGATVRVFEGADNCARRERGGLVVEVESTANLVHEIAHALVAERLDDDHGFQYGTLPLDLAGPTGRSALFDELAACVLSCAFSSRPADAWFREQFEIQPVFYGAEAPGDLSRAVCAVLDAYGAEARAFVQGVFERFDAALRAVRAAPWICRPIQSVSLDGLWRTYLVRLERRAEIP